MIKIVKKTDRGFLKKCFQKKSSFSYIQATNVKASLKDISPLVGHIQEPN